jgi:hypothetical protein
VSESAALSGLSLAEPPLSPTPPPAAIRMISPTPPPPPTPIAASSIETLLLREKLVTPDQIAHAMTVQVSTGQSIEDVVRANAWVTEQDLARLLAHVNPNATPPPAVVEDAAPQVVELPVAPLPFPTAAPEPVQETPAPEPVQQLPTPAPVHVAPVPTPEPVQQLPTPEPVHTVTAPEPVQPVIAAAPQPVQPVAAPEALQPIAAPQPVVEPVVAPPAPVQQVAEPEALQPVAPEPVQQVAPPAPTAGLSVEVMLRLTNGERIPMASFEDKDAAKLFALELSRQLATTADWPFHGGRFIRPEAVVSIDLDVTGF